MGNAEKVTRLDEKRVVVNYDGDLAVATGSSRQEKRWKNRTLRWSELLARFRDSVRGGETHAEYMRLPKKRQDELKDVGGFVGGRLREGKRKNGYVEGRQLITLDADFAPADLMQELRDAFWVNACAVYSTRKHCAAKPRVRLIIPLDREVTPDEYEAIARKVADDINIEYFDDSTYQAARLMYWPSHSSDVDPVFDFIDGPFLSADEVLAEYPGGNWADVSYWPMSSRAAELRKPTGPAADPLAKQNIVGVFCRTYTVTEAIRKFLPEVYVPTDKPDRWTYAAGSTAGGLVIYNDDTFAWSNHATDPAAGSSCNAFDIVRIHLFGELDDGHEDRTGTDRPSYKAMSDFAKEDPEVRLAIVREAGQNAREDFAEAAEETDDGWKKKLRVTDKGVVADSWNAELIFENDEHLKGIRFNEMSRLIEAKDVPWDRPAGSWRDADDAQLYQWLVRTYNVQFPKVKFDTALAAVADRRRFHPVREFLDGLPEWDGVPRVETLLVDLLGAEDSLYVREATRCSLTAAVARIYEPGIKFDNVLITQGPQSIGKSYLFNRLGGQWYSDNLSVSDMRDKTGQELLQGSWILELSELTGMRKAEVEAVKSFISRRVDEYRAAYGRHKETRPRQCIIVGSTNDDTGFLRDITGNRRFWPVKVTGQCDRHPWDLTDEDVLQIWAEAKVSYLLGEGMLLSREAEAQAFEAQRDAMEQDDRQGIVEEYLERLLPENWPALEPEQRLMFLESDEEGTVRRTEVSNMEIWVEALHGVGNKMDPNRDGRAISIMMSRIPGWRKTGERRRIPGYGLQRIYKRT